MKNSFKQSFPIFDKSRVFSACVFLMHPVLEIQYWVFFLAQAGKRDHIHMNGLNQIYIIYVSLTACKKNIFCTSTHF